jgi:hypothetical protein
MRFLLAGDIKSVPRLLQQPGHFLLQRHAQDFQQGAEGSRYADCGILYANIPPAVGACPAAFGVDTTFFLRAYRIDSCGFLSELCGINVPIESTLSQVASLWRVQSESTMHP